MNRNKAWRGIMLIVVIVIVVTALAVSFSTANVGKASAATLCGEGSAPDYGFTYDLQQPHWTVDGQGYASKQVIAQVDAILDNLNADSIAQTMILIKPQEQVGNRVNCAVHFLRYMQLGLPDGERKDNGFVFLIVVEPTKIDVHYGVGLGLPALTASELTPLNRAAEETYRSTLSIDQALLTLIQGFDTVVRSNYEPLIPPTPQPVEMPTLPSSPLGILALCGQLCLGIFLILILFWLLPKMAGSGTGFNPYGSSGSRRSSFPLGGGRGGTSSRGGSGSGRSGRGN